MAGYGNKNKQAGHDIEEKISVLLEKDGYEILGRNTIAGRVEMDIIAKKKGAIYFFEVKARHTGSMVSAFEAISAAKAARLRRGALAWLATYANMDTACAIALIAVTTDERNEILSWEIVPFD